MRHWNWEPIIGLCGIAILSSIAIYSTVYPDTIPKSPCSSDPTSESCSKYQADNNDDLQCGGRCY